MIDTNEFTIDDETINKVGLRLTDKAVHTQAAPDARIFDYPGLDNVFIMENDLYGNKVPKDSCFLAFYGQHGLIGQHLFIETLKNARQQDIKDIVETNNKG